MSSYTKKLSVLITVVIALSFVAITTNITAILQPQATYAGVGVVVSADRKSPIATSGDKNVYII